MAESPAPPADHPTAPAPDTPRARMSPRRRALIFGIAAAAIAVVVIFVVHYFSYASTHPSTDDATVNGDTVTINPKITGRVLSVPVRGDQSVHQGQLLVMLQPVDAEVQAEQAAAAASQALAAQAQVRAAQASAAAAMATWKNAQQVFTRDQYLYREGALAAQDRDTAGATAAADEAQYRNALGQVNAAISQQHAQAAQAQAQRVSAIDEANETQIVAPADGVIADQVSVQPGQVVQPGQALMTLVPASRRWVDANFEETQLRYVRVGQPATVHVDLLNQTFRGHVELIGPTTGAQLSVLPPENATGNFTKVVQRVPVRIAFDDPASQSLQIGLSVEVTVDTTQTPPPKTSWR